MNKLSVVSGNKRKLSGLCPKGLVEALWHRKIFGFLIIGLAKSCPAVSGLSGFAESVSHLPALS